MRTLVQHNPNMLNAVLQEIGSTNPQHLELISKNQDAFIRLINEPNSRGGDMRMKISIKSMTGKTFSLDVRPSNSVGEVKCLIWDKEGMPPDQMRLVFNSEQLQDDDRTLSDYNIEKDSVLHLLLKIRGC